MPKLPLQLLPPLPSVPSFYPLPLAPPSIPLLPVRDDIVLTAGAEAGALLVRRGERESRRLLLAHRVTHSLSLCDDMF